MLNSHPRFTFGFAISFAFVSAPAMLFAQQAQTPQATVTVNPEPVASINLGPVAVMLTPIVVPRLRVRPNAPPAEHSTTETQSNSGLDPDLEAIRQANIALVEDPVVARRGTRVAVATLAATGTLGGVGLLTTLGVGFGLLASGGVPVFIFSSVVGTSLGLFAIPAVYSAVSGAMGGNGSYWVTVGGQAVGLAVGGLLITVGLSSRSGELAGVLSFLGGAAIIASWGISYELSTTERSVARRTPQPRTTAGFSIYPGLLLNETQRGITLGGVF